MNNNQQTFHRQKVLITGGTGFIASSMARYLLELGADITLIVKPESDRWRIRDIAHQVNVQASGLQAMPLLEEVFASVRPDYVLHFAQPSHQLLRDIPEYEKQLANTASALTNLCELCLKYPVKAFVHACSSTVYRWSPEATLLSEATPLDPCTLRGMIKLNERNMCQYYAHQYQLPIRLARIFRAYGPWDSPDKLIMQALNSAYQQAPLAVADDVFKRDYVYIKDLARGILMLAQADLPAGTEINFAGGNSLSANDIIVGLEANLGWPIVKSAASYPRNSYDRGDYRGDITLAAKLLQWLPEIPVLEGLKQTVAWYQGMQIK